MRKISKTKAPTLVDVIFYTLYLAWFGKIIFENFFSKSFECSYWDKIGFILLAIPALIVLFLSHLIITIFVNYIERDKNNSYKFNWYILMIPIALFMMEYYSASRMDEIRKELEATSNLFETSLITSQISSGHSAIEFSFTRSGKFFLHEYDRISEDYEWTGYNIYGDTIILDKKLTYLPFDTAVIKNDTLHFIGDKELYNVLKKRS